MIVTFIRQCCMFPLPVLPSLPTCIINTSKRAKCGGNDLFKFSLTLESISENFADLGLRWELDNSNSSINLWMHQPYVWMTISWSTLSLSEMKTLSGYTILTKQWCFYGSTKYDLWLLSKCRANTCHGILLTFHQIILALKLSDVNNSN